MNNQAWDAFAAFAKRTLEDGTIEKEEIDYKTAIAKRLQQARSEFLKGSSGWPKTLKHGLTHNSNLLHFTLSGDFEIWIGRLKREHVSLG